MSVYFVRAIIGGYEFWPVYQVIVRAAVGTVIALREYFEIPLRQCGRRSLFHPDWEVLSPM
jgi:hypothetical protein